jgi:transposase-like protein
MPDHRDLIFVDETSAREFIETIRWPDGPTCTRCLSPKVMRLGGQTQAGMLLCRECRNKFTCRIGTSMEHSHVPLHKWLLALLLATNGERRLSPQKLKRGLGLGSYRTAWLMAQRIREALLLYRRENEKRARLVASRSSTDGPVCARRSSAMELDFNDAVRALIACPAKPSEWARIEHGGADAGITLPAGAGVRLPVRAPTIMAARELLNSSIREA